MTSAPDRQRAAPQLHVAIVLSAAEDECTVYAGDATRVVSYAEPFPRPREGRVAPGNLVAIAGVAGAELIVWRWFDAVVVDQAGQVVTLWEPNHGDGRGSAERSAVTSTDPVAAPMRRPACPARTGGWPAPRSTVRRRPAVDLHEVSDFFTSHGLWDRLT